MSSIVISGNTSGTVTLQAPDVAGTTTLTLPTTNATLAINGPAFSAYASAAQTVTLATQTKIAIDTEEIDTASCFDTANYRFTPTVAGYYQINGAMKGFVATTFSSITLTVYKNGSANTRLAQIIATLSPGTTTTISGSTTIYMNGTTDYIELYGSLGGTGTATISYSPTQQVTSTFSAALVRAA
jgi:hypothetical protein